MIRDRRTSLRSLSHHESKTMKKRLAFILLFIIIVGLISTSFADSYQFSDAFTDAEIVKAFFNGSGSSLKAEESFKRLYNFLYKDAQDYVLNRNTGKFHYPDCKSVTEQMKESNKVFITCSRDLLLALGYKPCGNCHP